MPTYFNLFPKVKYNDKSVVDITRKSSMIEDALNNSLLILPYTVVDGERPEDIAYAYYGTIEYYWVILMVNNINNYYEDWVMTSDAFNNYLMKKYEEQSGKKGYEVISWTQNEKILDNVLYYLDEDGIETSLDTIIINHVPRQFWDQRNTLEGQKFLIENFISNVEGFEPIRIYDYEYISNENKRKIKVINKNYIDRVIQDFKNSMR